MKFIAMLLVKNEENRYLREVLYYMSKAFLILTDSGGLIEEASFFGKPVLILRDVTERPEGLNEGTALLAGTEPGKIYSLVLDLSCPCSKNYNKMAVKKEIYGDGTAAEKIVKILREISDESYN